MRWLFCTLLIFSNVASGAEGFSSGPIYNGKTLERVNLQDVLTSIPAGSAVVLSEIHTLKSHHENQLAFIKELSKVTSNKINIGFEMFDVTEQNLLDDYSDQLITAEQLKSYVSLSKDWFGYYLPLLNFAQGPNSQAFALNAPKWLTSKIARVGLAQLSNFEKLLIPSEFELGDAAYLERFKEVTHIPQDKIQNYFEAQCTWDDVMAEAGKEYLISNPSSILVIIVGDFHAAYYGGLPKRLKARGINNVITISQVSTADMNEKEKDELLKPHPKYGPRADYIWVSEEAETRH